MSSGTAIGCKAELLAAEVLGDLLIMGEARLLKNSFTSCFLVVIQPLNCFIPPHTLFPTSDSTYQVYALRKLSLHLQAGARTCDVILPCLSLTHLLGLVGNARRVP